ncbi:MAG: TonB-dependent receptor [Ignavibacteriales bacterium]|nr:TonB-dependent receptor [Ignavibacteriales bacterium]
MRKANALTLFLIICFLSGTNILFAGTTGKIKGIVIDKNSGTPLPGVNVIIVGTPLGAAADLDGEFIILQIQPGTYTLKASMVGYQTVFIENVVVKVDLTTSVNIEMIDESISLNKEIIITAEAPVIQKDVTASIQNIGVREFERLPSRDAKQSLMVQAGVFFDPIPVVGGLGSAGKGENRYSVRGGSQDEVKWFIDGARVSNLLLGRADWGGSFTNINLYAIKEVQVMTGGFTAEYGEAESGIVSIVTKEGGNDFHGNAEVIYGLAGQHHFGNYLYDPKTQKEFLDNTLPDGSLDPNWWTPLRQSQIYDYREIPDYTYNLSLDGPLFNLGGSKINFFTTTQFKQQAYTLPHPRDSRNTKNVLFNLSYGPENIKMKLTGFYNHDAHSTLQENGDFTNQAKYYRGWGSLLDTYTYSLNYNFTHVLNDRLFYELKLGTYWSRFKERPSEYNLAGASKNPTIWGFHRFDGYESEPFDNYSPVIINDILTGDISLTGNINWQFDKNNLLKGGFEFRYNTYDEKENYRLPSFTRDKSLWLNRGLMETYHPIQGALYIQDKMEFESMILNIGLRYDYFDPNYDWFETTNLYNLSINPNYDPALDTDKDQIDNNGSVKYSFENVLNKPRKAAKVYHMISPRFGVSFPISENSLLHFNYGHYYQMPPLDQMFELGYFRPEYIVKKIITEASAAAAEGREPRHIASNDGDPERVVGFTNQALKPQKTIMFEAGIKQNFEGIAVLDVTAYYKDVFDQTSERIGLFDHHIYGWDPINNVTTPNSSYQTFLAGDYADSRGFEISLRTLFSSIIFFDINYSFSRATEGRATPGVIRYDEDGNVNYTWDSDVNKRIPVEKSYSRPHVLRVNTFIKYPDSDSPGLIDNIFHGTSLSLLFNYFSGQSFTYLQPTDPPDTYNNYRFRAIRTIDMKIEKLIELWDHHSVSLYMQVTNLLNEKNLRSYGDALFDAEATKNYIEKGTVTPVDADGYDIGWQNYFETRKFFFGMRYSF